MIKNIVDEETMLLFPIFNVPFDVHTDESDFLIGVLSFKYQKQPLYFLLICHTLRKIHIPKKKPIFIVDTLK